ncbi:MAG: hypothetical protein ACM3X0_03150 [Bacteroidota bacterium]
MTQLDRYVGRIVRLNQQIFQKILKKAARQGITLDNCFLVAAVSRELCQLICYGGNVRIAVGVPDVALI